MVEKMINHGTVQLETHCGDHLTALLYKKSNDLVDHCYLLLFLNHKIISCCQNLSNSLKCNRPICTKTRYNQPA